MSTPRTVVIPFGVPVEARGLGLGLAALIHACVSLDGGGMAIAQLHGRRNDEPEGTAPSPVEAFVPPAAWKDIAKRGETPNSVTVVVTGAFEPPLEGHGNLQLLAFDARDGKERARIEWPVDGTHAGASLVDAVEQLGARLGGEIGAFRAMRELRWDALESVLRAERCALHDPLRGGPHDRLAAMVHFGRAIGDAPSASYPADRLAAIALDSALGVPIDPRLAAAAARALERAVEDAPTRIELVEALAALEVRLGRARDAERRLNAALALAPDRPRLYALLSQALRAQGNLDGALATVESVRPGGESDVLLVTERGVVLAARGDLLGAAEAWQRALERDPVHTAAYTSLAALTLRTGEARIGQSLVDAALGAERAHPDVLRRAVQLVLATETEGLARASRVATLCERIIQMVPGDAWASLALARAEAVLGRVAEAHVRLKAIDQGAPGSAASAEAQVARMEIDQPAVHGELDRVLRAAQSAPPPELSEIAARARRVATLHASWLGWVAAAVAERRLGRWAAARGAAEVALEMAPGAAIAHVELAEVLLELDDPAGALQHAERAGELELGSPRAASLKARALQSQRRAARAREKGWGARLKGVFAGWKRG